MLASELEKLGPAEKLAHAREVVISFAGSKLKSSECRTIEAFRNHFDSLKMIALERKLGCDWQKLIGELIKSGDVRATNGYVWAK